MTLFILTISSVFSDLINRFDDVLFGLVSALIGAFLAGTSGRISTARKLNRTRKLLVSVIESTTIVYCEKYLKETKNAVLFVERFHELKRDNFVDFDNMPMFNSDVFKRIDPEVLHSSSFNTDIYKDTLSLMYGIDFLKENMPHQRLDIFKEDVRIHLMEKKVDSLEHSNHLSKCTFYEDIKSTVINYLEMKIETANQLKVELKSVHDSLNGNNFLWLLCYMWKQ